MSKGGLKLALPLVLAHEGGFSDHPADPGGATMKGVTQAIYDAYRSRKGEDQRSVRLISSAELTEIYRVQYWDAIQGDKLPAGLDYAVFDFAVNSGAAQAVKELQRVIGAGVDGRIGLKTIDAICAAAANDDVALIEAYCDRRLGFMKKLKTWKTFGRGWERRVMGRNHGAQDGDDGVLDYAVKIARDDLAYPIKPHQLPAPIGARAGELVAAKAEPAETAVLKTGAGKGALATAGGLGLGGVTTLADLGEKVTDGADRVSTTTTSVRTAAEATSPLMHGVTMPIVMLVCIGLAACGLVFLLYQLTKLQREKA